MDAIIKIENIKNNNEIAVDQIKDTEVHNVEIDKIVLKTFPNIFVKFFMDVLHLKI